MATFFEQQRQEKAAQRTARAQELAAQKEERANRVPAPTRQEKASEQRSDALREFKNKVSNSPESVMPTFPDYKMPQVKEAVSRAISTGKGFPSLFKGRQGIAANNLPVSDNLNHYHFLLSAAREVEDRISNAEKGSTSATRYGKAREAINSVNEELNKHFESHLKGAHIPALDHLTNAAKLIDSAVKYGDAASEAAQGVRISSDDSSASSWGDNVKGPNVKLGVDEAGLNLSDRLGAVVDGYKSHLAKVAGNNPKVNLTLRQGKFAPSEGDFTPPKRTKNVIEAKEPKDLGPKRLKENPWDISALPTTKNALTSHLKSLREGSVLPGSEQYPVDIAERAYVGRVKDAAGAKLDNKSLFKAPELAGLRYSVGGPSDAELKRQKEIPEEELKKATETPTEQVFTQDNPEDLRPKTGTAEGRIGLGGHFATGNEAGRK